MRLLVLAIAWIATALPALAACDGRDLRPSLTQQQRATLQAALADTPYPQGNHWRATRGSEVLHLIGTIHLDDPRLDAPTARLRPLIETADRLLLEMTSAEEAELARALQSRPDLLLLPDTTLPEILPEEDWQRLAEAMRARNLPPFMAAKFQPWYVSMLLSVPPCLMAQLTGGAGAGGLDKRLTDIAAAAGVPMQALEPFDTAFRAFNAAPRETQIAMMRLSIGDPAATEDQFATLQAAYFDERPAESWLMTAILAPQSTAMDETKIAAVFAELETALLDTRNRAWIPVILQALAETDGPVVAAFGAAHLPGETGVLALLEAEGFVLERLPF
ncbi:TraB/GumN family protein [Thalassococcus sp. CAU 1522]|uniref:TraB/GumN family protein n=1 Tax=Thalassococcus arenae TaxID=2851652 RepID=A0ABS6N7I0_9RHOB|nr:TraB/GumN family protein [Thalassococcus arenae]MBV2359974.1 TraB/GumN family protein [Thalassococcus arenae]